MSIEEMWDTMKKIKPLHYKNKWERRIPGQWNRQDLQQDHERNFPKLMKEAHMQIWEMHRTPMHRTSAVKDYRKKYKAVIMKTQLPLRTQLTTPKINNPMTLINTHTSPLALNINAPNPILKSHRLDEWIKKQNPSICCL